MKDSNFKDLRKAAFAVGVGLTVGKYVGKCFTVGMEELTKAVVKQFAKNGNKYAQRACDEANIRYEEDSKENKSEVTMGFHG